VSTIRWRYAGKYCKKHHMIDGTHAQKETFGDDEAREQASRS